MIDPDKEEYQEYKGRLVHPDCFRNLIKELNTNAKQKKAEKKAKTTGTPTVKVKELKDGISEEEFAEKQSFFEEVKKILKTDTLPAKVYAMSKNYMEQYNFTWIGMKRAIEYFYVLKENEVKGDNIVGIIPYCYQDAQKFFSMIDETTEANSKIDTSKLYQEKLVKIDVASKRKKPKLFDISKIGG